MVDMTEEKEIREAYEKDVANLEELKTVVQNCAIPFCDVRRKIEELKNRHAQDILTSISLQDFHFFMCYRGNLYPNINGKPSEKTVVEHHEEIIRKSKTGYCWWAKFNQLRKANGTRIDLEPFGESMKLQSSVPAVLRENVQKRIETGKPVYLFNYSPNPSEIELIVCNVNEFYYGKLGEIPYAHSSNTDKPECASMPSYYFMKRSDCNKCTGFDPERCVLRFPSYFWFKIDEIAMIDKDEIGEVFKNLKNCFTNDHIDFSVPIFYPLLAFQILQRLYFPRHILSHFDVSPEARREMENPEVMKQALPILKALVEGKELPMGTHYQKWQSSKNEMEARLNEKWRMLVRFEKDKKIGIRFLLSHKH